MSNDRQVGVGTFGYFFGDFYIELVGLLGLVGHDKSLKQM